MSDFAPEPDVQPADEAAGDAAVEQPWAPNQDEWAQLQNAVTVLAQLEQQRAAVYQPPSQQQPDDYDPFNPDSVRNLIKQEVAPYAQFQQETQLAEAEQQAMDILSNLASRHGDADLTIARMRADSLLPAMQQKYGPSARAAEAALEQAYHDQKKYEEKKYSDAVSQHSNQIATLAGAPGEPGSTYTVGVQQRTMPNYREGGRVTDRFFGDKAN